MSSGDHIQAPVTYWPGLLPCPLLPVPLVTLAPGHLWACSSSISFGSSSPSTLPSTVGLSTALCLTFTFYTLLLEPYHPPCATRPLCSEQSATACGPCADRCRCITSPPAGRYYYNPHFSDDETKHGVASGGALTGVPLQAGVLKCCVTQPHFCGCCGHLAQVRACVLIPWLPPSPENGSPSWPASLPWLTANGRLLSD